MVAKGVRVTFIMLIISLKTSTFVKKHAILGGSLATFHVLKYEQAGFAKGLAKDL